MQDDLIRRGDAVKTLNDIYAKWGYPSGTPPELLNALNNLPAVTPEQAAKLEPVVPTRVRCWNARQGVFAMNTERDGKWFSTVREVIEASNYTITQHKREYEEITPAAAAALLRDWPEGRERFLAYCKEHPAEKPKTVADDIIEGLTELNDKLERGEPVEVTTVRKVRTVTDVLREMPVGQRFTRPKWREEWFVEKCGDNQFKDQDGDCHFVGSRLAALASAADDPHYGIILLDAPPAPVPPVSEAIGRMVNGDEVQWYNDSPVNPAPAIHPAAKLLIDLGKLDAAAWQWACAMPGAK